MPQSATNSVQNDVREQKGDGEEENSCFRRDIHEKRLRWGSKSVETGARANYTLFDAFCAPSPEETSHCFQTTFFYACSASGAAFIFIGVSSTSTSLEFRESNPYVNFK